MKVNSSKTIACFQFKKSRDGVLVIITSILVSLVYIFSTNGIFIPVAGFDFNPSKLLVILLLPILLLTIRGNIFQQEDIFFCIFIILAFFKAAIFQDTRLITSLSNFLIPFLYYITIRINLKKINLKFIITFILLWSTLHASFGLLQFFTGDKDLLLVEATNEFKLKYASNYAFNPFEELLLLPQGLYGYSSVLAISLIFPLFLLAGARHFLPRFFVIVALGVISTTIFVCFSRFEILSLLLLIALSVFVVKDQVDIIFSRLILLVAILIAAILAYLAFTDDPIGSVSARVVTIDVLGRMVGEVNSFLLGIPTIFDFLENYGFNIPHNMYLYLWIAYGIIAACFFSAYLWFKTINYYKFYKRTRQTGLVIRDYFSLYVFSLLFLLFLLCLRAFDYYIVDGYENILLIFFCFLILDKIKDLHYQSNHE